jgi:Uma2 family endonuclease
VLSDPHHDRVRKRGLYARFGVSEYWIVDADGDRVEVHRLEGDDYPAPAVLEPGATLTTPLLPGLEIGVADLLAEAG